MKNKLGTRNISTLDKPFTVVISGKDLEHSKQLIKGIECTLCRDSRFKVEVLTRSKITLVTGGEELIIVDRDDEEIHVIKVLSCARCNSKVFNDKI